MVVNLDVPFETIIDRIKVKIRAVELSVKVKPEITRTESEDPNLKKKTFVYIKKSPIFQDRWIHPGSGRVYNLIFNPPKTPGKVRTAWGRFLS